MNPFMTAQLTLSLLLLPLKMCSAYFLYAVFIPVVRSLLMVLSQCVK